MRVLAIILLACFLSCKNAEENYTENMQVKPESEMAFDREKWDITDGKNYPFREQMLNDIVYNDTIRSLSKSEIITLLGEPTYYRDNENVLYYTISRKRVGSMTLHTKSMVIQFIDDNQIEWIKIHE